MTQLKCEKEIYSYLLSLHTKRAARAGQLSNVSEGAVRFVAAEDIQADIKADFQVFNDALISLRNNGFISVKSGKYITSGIEKVKLIPEMIEKACRRYSITPLQTEAACKQAILDEYKNKSVIVDKYIDDLAAKVQKLNFSGDLKDNELLAGVLAGMVAVISNEKPIKYRELSIDVYHDSKIFETKYLSRVCSEICRYGDFDAIEDKKDVLGLYNVYPGDPEIWFKGNAIVKDVDFPYDENCLKIVGPNKQGMTLDGIIEKTFHIKGREVFTVENKTSFETFNRPDAFVVYLAGFASSSKIDFLKKLYNENPKDIQYYHFGDIDFGGFSILLDLKKRTGIDFEPFYMDIETLANEDYIRKPLTQNDKGNLQRLKTKAPEFAEIIDYMLTNNVKLEQENIRI